jgi:malate synthase
VNARWGSLLDVFYGTDAGPSEADGCGKRGPNGEAYNPRRGAKVLATCFEFLDAHFPLKPTTRKSGGGGGGRGEKKSSSGPIACSWAHVAGVRVANRGRVPLALCLTDGSMAALKHAPQFVAFMHEKSMSRSASSRRSNSNSNSNSDESDALLTSLLLLHNHLHVEIVFDSQSVVGRDNAAGIHDILLESAVTAIVCSFVCLFLFCRFCFCVCKLILHNLRSLPFFFLPVRPIAKTRWLLWTRRTR